MPNLENNKQESFDLTREDIATIDAASPLDNTQKAIDSIDDGKEIKIKENFKEVCNILKKGNDTEKELAKLKLLVHLGNEGVSFDYDKVEVTVEKGKGGKESIVFREKIDRGNMKGTKTCTLTNEGGKRYYDRNTKIAMAN